MTENNVKLIEMKYSSVHVLKLYKDLDAQLYFITLRNSQEAIVKEIAVGKRYKQVKSARRAIERLHEQLCQIEDNCPYNGGDLFDVGLR